jgi:hypothetical protein
MRCLSWAIATTCGGLDGLLQRDTEPVHSRGGFRIAAKRGRAHYAFEPGRLVVGRNSSITDQAIVHVLSIPNRFAVLQQVYATLEGVRSLVRRCDAKTFVFCDTPVLHRADFLPVLESQVVRTLASCSSGVRMLAADTLTRRATGARTSVGKRGHFAHLFRCHWAEQERLRLRSEIAETDRAAEVDLQIGLGR